MSKSLQRRSQSILGNFLIDQKQKDKDKTYSLRELHIYAIAKGKDRKKYEYVTKISIVTTTKSNIIIGVSVLEKMKIFNAFVQLHRLKPCFIMIS